MESVRRTGKPAGGRWVVRRWRRSRPGRRLLAAEEAQLRRLLPELFGELCLLVGDWGDGERMLQAAGHFPRRGVLRTAGDGGDAVGSPEQFPLPDKIADAVVLQHVLEYCPDPRQALREAVRVLSDRGVLVVFGINPWSGWGLRHALGLDHRALPPGARLVSAGRLRDWLEVLGLSVDGIRHFAPARSRATRLLTGPLAALQPLYLLSARKRVRPLTPVMQRLRQPLRVVSGNLALPEARTRQAWRMDPNRSPR